MSKYLNYFVSSFLLTFICNYALAEVIDPETYILKNGYQTTEPLKGEKGHYYGLKQLAESPQIKALELEIAQLPKAVEVQNLCDAMRGAGKVKAIERTGKGIDVALTDYGYKGNTIACVLKFMYESVVVTELIYTKEVSDGSLYKVVITESKP